ncbi:NYN domain-containing protein [Candidatus Pacearchaeota archaeon]|nr:NYN domain-containing protein [Candidatus Pacearchaeota archaeon]
MERVMIFIDGSNLYHILKKFYKNKDMNTFNFDKFIKLLSKNRNLIRTYYYNAILNREEDPEKYAKQQKFFEKLRLISNFELIPCRMQKDFVDGKVRYFVKGDDISIAVDMLKLAYNNAYDTAVLVSTDGDFVPVIKAVKEIGKRVENIGFINFFSWHLKQTCDKFDMLKKQELDTCY